MNGLNKQTLRAIIDESSFAMLDAGLFLDTHPDSIEALDFFHKARCLRQEAMEEYTRNFGPLTPQDVDTENIWTWNSGPWPWEGDL